MTTQKKSGKGKLIAWMILFLIIIVACVLLFQPIRNKLTTPGNTTIVIENQTNVQQTIVEPGESNWPDVIKAFIIWIPLTALFAFIAFLAFKLFSVKKPFSQGNKKLCEKKAREQLREQQFYPGTLKYSQPYYSGNDEKHKFWLFVFTKENIDATKSILSRYLLMHCLINCKTLEICNEGAGKSIIELEEYYRLKGFGKEGGGVPIAPTKIEKEPHSFDEIMGYMKPKVSLESSEE